MEIESKAWEVILVMEPSFADAQTIIYAEILDESEVRHTIRIATRSRKNHEEGQGWERRLSAKEVKQLMKALDGLTISGLPFAPLYVNDGTQWSLGISCGHDSLTLRWWQHLPKKWETVWELVRVMQGLANYKTEPQWWQVWR